MNATAEPFVKLHKVYLPAVACTLHGRALHLYPNALRLPYFPCPECETVKTHITMPSAQRKPFDPEQRDNTRGSRFFEKIRVTWRGCVRLAWKQVAELPKIAPVERPRVNGKFVKLEMVAADSPEPLTAEELALVKEIQAQGANAKNLLKSRWMDELIKWAALVHLGSMPPNTRTPNPDDRFKTFPVRSAQPNDVYGFPIGWNKKVSPPTMTRLKDQDGWECKYADGTVEIITAEELKQCTPDEAQRIAAIVDMGAAKFRETMDAERRARRDGRR